MRRVPSRTTQVLDEAGTVDRIAQEDLWIPVLKPEQERWFTVDLVIEASSFSFIWQSTLEEFRQILVSQGAFRQVRPWWVQAGEDGQPRLVSRPPTQTPGLGRSHRELVDVTGRSLVLYVSDCRSSLWQRGTIHPWLQLWGQYGPTAVIQLLPAEWWDTTDLDGGDRIQASAFSPGSTNPKLYLHQSPQPYAGPRSLALPVVTLTEAALKQWALVVAGVGGRRVPARLFDLEWTADPEREMTWQPPTFSSADDQVSYFRATASSTAQQLAQTMAALPVSLPVVHLIQKHLLPGASAVHVAEVYNGLLRSQSHSSGAEPRYDFGPGIRQQLIETTPLDETLQVLDELSKAIAKTLGFEIKSFTALLSPRSTWTEDQKATILPFAQIATEVLHYMGGDYAILARQVEEDAARQPGWITPSLGTDPSPDGPPDLQTLVFQTARLIESDPAPATPELEPFSFTIATLQRQPGPGQKQSQNRPSRKGQQAQPTPDWVIQRQPGQAYRYVETLPDQSSLELVAIPGGSFMMGSPKGELERSENESPQHEVTLAPFLMGRYPITQAQWRAVASLPQVERELDPNPSNFKGDSRPVEQVNWFEAMEFCARLSAHSQRPYTLPSEAQWEYACRAGTTSPFHFGETITPELANYDGNYTYADGPKGEYRQQTTPVDQFGVANAWGLAEMHGNVWEWCLDHYHDSYAGAPRDGSAWVDAEAEEDKNRIRRGGSWVVNPWSCRCAYRFNCYPDFRFDFNGFRVVSVPPRALG
jgi:formylglycine-generating enzyme required for sulfatase activity